MVINSWVVAWDHWSQVCGFVTELQLYKAALRPNRLPLGVCTCRLKQSVKSNFTIIQLYLINMFLLNLMLKYAAGYASVLPCLSVRKSSQKLLLITSFHCSLSWIFLFIIYMPRQILINIGIREQYRIDISTNNIPAINIPAANVLVPLKECLKPQCVRAVLVLGMWFNVVGDHCTSFFLS